MKVVSLLPSATELVCAAGGEGFLVGRSHECDYPPSIRDRPILTAAKNKFESMSQMNDAVTASLGAGEGLYTVDKDLLLRLNPDVIVTQSLCEVCSVDLALVERICAKALPSANIISLNPFTIEEVLEDVLRVGTAMQQEAAAQAAVADMQRRIDTAKTFVASQPPLKLNNVAMLEWFDPFFPGGHWTPQLVSLAGGTHPLNAPRSPGAGAPPSKAVTNEALIASDPDCIIICPCGLDLSETYNELPDLVHRPWWKQLRAVQEGRVVLVDGNAMFNRPGPRLVDCLEFLVGLLHGREDLMPQGYPWEYLQLDKVADRAPRERPQATTGCCQPQQGVEQEAAAAAEASAAV